MREADRLTSERHNLPGPQLMENAGRAVMNFLQSEIRDFSTARIAVLCGKGNNGGDGFVIARLLKECGANPKVLLFTSPDAIKGDARLNFDRWKKGGGE